MQRTRIKICGITNRDDAMCAVDHGADAIGFIFVASSPRSIEINKAASIIASLPAYVTTVGVIVNETLEAANAIAANTGVQLLQCHGDEDETYCEQLASPYVKVIRLHAVSAIRPYESRYPGATALMLEKRSDKAYGGTGETLAWDEPAPYPGLILAGGLTPENVLRAVLDVRPHAVDVASGVEREPGLKDPRKIREFVAAVRAADKECENE